MGVASLYKTIKRKSDGFKFKVQSSPVYQALFPCIAYITSLDSTTPAHTHTHTHTHMQLYFTQVEFFAAVFLMAILACSLAAITLFRFRIHRPFAIFLIAIYVVFLIIAILAEVPVFTLSISGVLS